MVYRRFLFLIPLFSFVMCFGQVRPVIVSPPDSIKIDLPVNGKAKQFDIRESIIKAFFRSATLDTLYAVPKNHVYLISVAVSFNAQGKVDTAYLPANMTDRVKNFIKPDQDLINRIKRIKMTNHILYKNKILVMPILFGRLYDSGIDFSSGFLKDFEQLWPNLTAADKNKEVILLKPYECLFHTRI